MLKVLPASYKVLPFQVPIFSNFLVVRRGLNLTASLWLSLCGFIMVLGTELLVHKICCVNVSVFDVTVDLLRDGGVGPTPNLQPGGLGAVFAWPFSRNLRNKVGPTRVMRSCSDSSEKVAQIKLLGCVRT